MYRSISELLALAIAICSLFVFAAIVMDYAMDMSRLNKIKADFNALHTDIHRMLMEEEKLPIGVRENGEKYVVSSVLNRYTSLLFMGGTSINRHAFGGHYEVAYVPNINADIADAYGTSKTIDVNGDGRIEYAPGPNDVEGMKFTASGLNKPRILYVRLDKRNHPQFASVNLELDIPTVQ